VGEIRTRLTPSVRTAPVRRSVNAQAQEAYLRGRHALRTEIEEHRRRAAEFFEEAIRLDPAFAVAYQGLADYYGATDAVSPEAAASNARKYALKALELEPTLASAHSTLAQASMWADWDWPVAEREFERSLDLDPNDAATRRWYGLFLDVTGRPRAASAQLRRARELDPVSPMTYFALSHHLFLARRFDEAIAQARIVEEISPHDPAVIESLGSLYGVLGDHDRAVATFERGIVLWGRDPALVFGLALAQAAAGSRDGAKRLLDELYEAARRRYVPPVWFARVHMALGDRDLAFEWMEKGFQARDGSLVHLKVSPIFDRIRGDARFPDLLRRMNFPRAAPDS
jgi:tetratricopeptide (TPR) repeat protein